MHCYDKLCCPCKHVPKEFFVTFKGGKTYTCHFSLYRRDSYDENNTCWYHKSKFVSLKHFIPYYP